VDFPTQVCVHAHDLPVPPSGQRLPVLVLTTPRLDLIVIEGMPSYEELKAHVERLLGK
jgi:hypothetical protein